MTRAKRVRSDYALKDELIKVPQKKTKSLVIVASTPAAAAATGWMQVHA